ncbi:Nephrocystin-3 [Homo sapiens] [Rhizoctonia solani]|uniref:Nephrocystin-3 [Homo sapiens] n=1 Tax=Rhizoctonia solani TaxID=456999 RepID=A0A0K6G9U6_9AGAM|nr:Nephrocystin-3 [Homo sapiens] [Rhizoctonia solani]
MSDKKNSGKGLNILCLDGGGARGLSSLVVLREIMHRINSKRGEGAKLLQPYEHFDVIAGTGTGGISACMIGRLRMPIDNAIEEYAKMMESIFSEKKMSGPTMYKSTRLEEALKAVIQNAMGNKDERMIEDRGGNGCKTQVFFSMDYVGIPVLFRSYIVSANPGPDCPIWKALRATMAHPDFFKEIEIPDNSVPQSFIGGEIGCSNPLAHVLSEVSRIYPGHRVACIVSIGAGHTRTIQLPATSRLRLLLRTQDVIAMKGMATDSERVAEEMAERFQDTTGVYFRFNVDQGVQDMKDRSWERLGETMEHTKAYLQRNETNQRVESAVKASIEKQIVLNTTQTAGRISGPSEVVQQAPKLKRCPAPTPVYTGREDENVQLTTCITGSKNERRVCVIYGLGGAGKTQLVLNVVERTRDDWDYVIFVDASSRVTVEGDLKNFAVAKDVGDTYEDAIRWLESCHERWLVIYDNADTPSTNIRQYIPGGRHGSILITTRLPDLARLAKGPGSVCHMSGMSYEDGLALFMKTACMEDLDLGENDISAAEALIKDFGTLALAIVHAGAYIAHSSGMSFAKYRELFLSQRQRMLELYGELPDSVKLDDYGKTVYTTWRMCYDQLQPESRTMLWLISYLHYTHVSEEIFQRASQNMHRRYYPLPLGDLESQAQNHVKQFLSEFLTADGQWDTVKFIGVMADLKLYSLVDYDRMNVAYSMHVLVQDWARTVIPQEPGLAIECAAALISLSINEKDDTESLAFNRRMALHTTSLLVLEYTIGVNHAYWFKEAPQAAGQWAHHEQIEMLLLEALKKEYGEEHKETLSSMNCLATTYERLDRRGEAEKLQVQLVESSKRVLGAEHRDTLTYIANLASNYSKLGRHNKAVQLQIQVLNTTKRLLGEDHPDTLSNMSQLAWTYGQMKCWDEAEELRRQVLEMRKRVLGENHPKTFYSMAGLAQIYSHLGRWDEAVSLLTTALTLAQQHLGTEHPNSKRYLRWLERAQNKRII